MKQNAKFTESLIYSKKTAFLIFLYSDMSTHAGIEYSKALEVLKEHMEAEGFLFEHDENSKSFSLLGQTFDTKGKIIAKTAEMIKRT